VGALLEDARRNLLELAALPARRGVEVDAVRARVQIGAALLAHGIELDRLGNGPLLAALGAPEHRIGRCPEAAPARSLLLLPRRLRPRRPRLGRPARVLIAAMAVLPFIRHEVAV